MHLILTGATGLVGSAALDAMIKMKDVTKISILSRRPVKMAEDAKDPRINVILHKDFEKYDTEVLSKLEGADGCVWALGISQSQVGKEEYVKITKTYAVEAAKAFSTLPGSSPFRFIFVSGEGTTQTPGMFTPIFARVKGETEVLLSEMRAANPRLLAESVRPGFVDESAHDVIKPYLPVPGMFINTAKTVLGPVLRTMHSRMSPTEPLGKFLVGMAMGSYDGRLEGKGVFTLNGGLRVVENIGFRRLYGLPA